ncbi:MAG: sigma-70 family RNA polymerase sigma factor [Verrucomicrobiota bacterium]|nr:sigma-70 family RNA polymerase sigma factor [Verrucomicrobiota bacterium]
MPNSAPPDSAALFVTTRWSVVLAAQDAGVGDATAALETLCRTYWRVLYGYARRHGYSPHDAEDATQAFFARLLEKDYLQAVRRELGPFRAFLQMAFKRFLSKERERASAALRGGGVKHIPFDLATAESCYNEDAPHLPADEVFEHRWALTVLATVMQTLREEFRAAGKEAEFDILKAALSAPKDGLHYDEMAAALGATEGAVRTAAHRLRKRCRQLFRLEVAQTVAAHEDVEEEARHLVAVLARM